MRTTLLSLLVIAGLCSGCTSSYIYRATKTNPLPAMATFAHANNYMILQSDDSNLRVQKNVNWGMMFLGSRNRFVGDYKYYNGNLNAEVYLAQTGLWGLGMGKTRDRRQKNGTE